MSPDSASPDHAVTLSHRSRPESASAAVAAAAASPSSAAVETPADPHTLGDSPDQPVLSPIAPAISSAPAQSDQPGQSLSPVLSAVSASSLVQDGPDPGRWDLHSPSFSHLQDPAASPKHGDHHHHHQQTPSLSQKRDSQRDESDYGSQFSNDNLHSRLVSEPFIPILLSPASQKTQAMALHPPPNRPPPLRIDSASARKASASSFELKQQQQNPRTPGNKISNFFGWKAPVTSPGAESSSTEISDGGRSPLASPMPPSSLPSGSYAITPATTIPFDNSKPARNGSLSSSSMLDSKLADLENELREISSELAGSIRREMELEDLVDRLQSEMPMDNSNRRTSDYFSDSGTSSIRYPQDTARPEDLDKFRRTAEQERAQLKVELSNKWQEERSKRIATESHIQILENQVSQLRRERVELSELASKNRELESRLEDTKRRLHEEREVKDNFEDLLTAMRVEFEQLRNGTYKSSDPDTERLMGEIEALKIENASLAQLQGSRFASIVEETERSPRASGLGLSRSNSRPSRPGSLYGAGGAWGSKERDHNSPQSLADRMNDVEAQRDALHQSLRNLLQRQQLEAREYEKRTRLLEFELARAQETGSPRKLGYERDVRNLREEVNHLRQRAEDALDQKWQCEKGLSGLKMDLDRAEQETASLRELLQEQAGSSHSMSSDGFAEVLATSSSLEEAFRQLQSDREQAQNNVAQSPVDATADLAASLSRTEALTAHVHSQLQNNSSLRQRLADAIGKGEKEQQLSATRINELQAQLKSLEDMLLTAQQQSEDEMAKHEDEIRLLQDTQSDQLQRMVNGGRSPVALSSSPFLNSARSPQLDKTTSGDGVPLSEVVQHEVLAKRVRELERMLRMADHEMEEVVGRMNRAQIDVGELQSDRDNALRETRKLQAEILAERELFRSLLNQ